MSAKRKIEAFTAGCPVCEQTVELVKRIVCESCDVTILDLHNAEVAKFLDYQDFYNWHSTFISDFT